MTKIGSKKCHKILKKTYPEWKKTSRGRSEFHHKKTLNSDFINNFLWHFNVVSLTESKSRTKPYVSEIFLGFRHAGTIKLFDVFFFTWFDDDFLWWKITRKLKTNLKKFERKNVFLIVFEVKQKMQFLQDCFLVKIRALKPKWKLKMLKKVETGAEAWINFQSLNKSFSVKSLAYQPKLRLSTCDCSSL